MRDVPWVNAVQILKNPKDWGRWDSLVSNIANKRISSYTAKYFLSLLKTSHRCVCMCVWLMMFIHCVCVCVSLSVCTHTTSQYTMEDRGQCSSLGSPCTVWALELKVGCYSWIYILRHPIVLFLSPSTTVALSCPPFQTIIDAKHVHMYLFATCISSLMNCVYKSFIHLKKSRCL